LPPLRNGFYKEEGMAKDKKINSNRSHQKYWHILLIYCELYNAKKSNVGTALRKYNNRRRIQNTRERLEEISQNT